MLLVYAGIDGLRAFREIQRTNNAVREDYLRRTRVLDRIRSNVYISGTFVRDYLLEPEPLRAESNRASLLATERDIRAAMAEYGTLLTGAELRPFQDLMRQMDGYWSVLAPTFRWTPEERRRHGYTFLRDEVFPRRTTMLGIAGQIGAMNESQLNAGKARLEEAFGHYQQRLAVTVGLAALFGLLLAAFSFSRILGLEREAGERYQEISRARSQLQQLSARLVQIQEDERRTISRELHDEVGQALSGALVELANLTSEIRASNWPALGPATESIKKQVEHCIDVVRNMALLLRPSMLDDIGLVPALEWQARETARHSGLRVKVAAEEIPEDLPEPHKVCIYRIVQEALHNCLRHARARSVRVSVGCEQRHITLSVQDDGAGFDARLHRGMGLLGMEERATHLGGSFAVESEPGKGTLLRVMLPLPDPTDPQGEYAGPEPSRLDR